MLVMFFTTGNSTGVEPTLCRCIDSCNDHIRFPNAAVADFVGVVAVDHQLADHVRPSFRQGLRPSFRQGLRPSFNADYHNVCFDACLSPATFHLPQVLASSCSVDPNIFFYWQRLQQAMFVVALVRTHMLSYFMASIHAMTKTP